VNSPKLHPIAAFTPPPPPPPCLAASPLQHHTLLLAGQPPLLHVLRCSSGSAALGGNFFAALLSRVKRKCTFEVIWAIYYSQTSHAKHQCIQSPPLLALVPLHAAIPCPHHTHNPMNHPRRRHPQYTTQAAAAAAATAAAAAPQTAPPAGGGPTSSTETSDVTDPKYFVRMEQATARPDLSPSSWKP